MWLQPSPWLDTTALCSGDEVVEKTVDGGTEGEVRSETGKKKLFHQRDDGFACARRCRIHHGDLFGAGGAIPRPLKSSKTVSMTSPRHNSDYC